MKTISYFAILFMLMLSIKSFSQSESSDLSKNYVKNGNFEQGNIDFLSNYTYTEKDLYPEGTYSVVSNPNKLHSHFNSCSEHYKNNGGKILAVNGSTTKDKIIWQQKIKIKKKKYYEFAADFGKICGAPNPVLKFMINDEEIGNLHEVFSPIGTFSTYQVGWFSEKNTKITISIIDKCTAAGGNDFGIDNIVFKEVSEERYNFLINQVE